jgi:hypothetical protein
MKQVPNFYLYLMSKLTSNSDPWFNPDIGGEYCSEYEDSGRFGSKKVVRQAAVFCFLIYQNFPERDTLYLAKLQ